MIRRDWFKWYSAIDRDKHDLIVQSWDTEVATGADNSYSVCLTFGLRESRYHLLHVLRERTDFPALKKSVRIHARTWGANCVLVEKAALGYSLLQDYGRDPAVPLIGIRPEADKVTRLVLSRSGRRYARSRPPVAVAPFPGLPYPTRHKRLAP